MITGYSGRINYGRTGAVVETITKLRLTRDLALAQGSRSRAEFPKVQEVLTVASDPRCFLRPVMGRQSEARIAANECIILSAQRRSVTPRNPSAAPALNLSLAAGAYRG